MNRNQDSKALSTPMQRYNLPATLEGADIVIIGNGIAGLTAAIEARRYDADKRIVIITDQPHSTINTPALKQFAINKLKREQLLAYPPDIEQSLNINIIRAHVEEIHAESKYLRLNGNRSFGYRKLLIATGSLPSGLPEKIPGRDFDGVIVLHRLKDYQDLRRRLPEVREAVVIGGGTHANETVMTLLHWGVRVHWLIRGKTFFPSTLDSTASEMILNRVRRAGAIVHTQTEVSAIIGRVATVTGVLTKEGATIPCQLVISCIGTYPALSLAKQCTAPMIFKDGILVDGRLRTSVPDIYAAGDVAALPNPQTGYYETRGQWYFAVTQGKIAGAMMTGQTEIAQELFGAPWLATQLGKLSMLTVGDPLGAGENEQATIYTDISGGGYRRLAVVEDRLVGYLSVGATHADGLSIKRLIDEGFSVGDFLKPLLKGKFDAHRYLTQPKTRMTSTQPLPILQDIQTFKWPDTISDLQAIQWLEAEKQQETLPSPEEAEKQQESLPSPEEAEKQQESLPSSEEAEKQQESLPSSEEAEKQQETLPSSEEAEKQQETLPSSETESSWSLSPETTVPTDAPWLLSSEPTIPVAQQTAEIPLAMDIKQATRAEASYQPGKSHSNKENDLTRLASKSQFVKPGFIDPRYNKHKNVVPHGQSEQKRTTDPLSSDAGSNTQPKENSATDSPSASQERTTDPLLTTEVLDAATI